MSDIAAVIARLRERDLRERWDDDILALIAAYEAEKERGKREWEEANAETALLEARAERAEQERDDALDHPAGWHSCETRIKHAEVRAGEARKHIEALLADLDSYEHGQNCDHMVAARAFLASTEPQK